MSDDYVLSKLLAIQTNGPSVRELGICDNLDFDSKRWAKSKWVNWPKYSGVLNYPVPHHYLPPATAFYSIADVWDRRTRYGKDRWELLDWLIEKRKAMVRA